MSNIEQMVGRAGATWCCIATFSVRRSNECTFFVAVQNWSANLGLAWVPLEPCVGHQPGATP